MLIMNRMGRCGSDLDHVREPWLRWTKLHRNPSQEDRWFEEDVRWARKLTFYQWPYTMIIQANLKLWRCQRLKRCTVVIQGVNPWIEVDGGVTPKNAYKVIEAGANALVAGSAVFGAKDYAEGKWRTFAFDPFDWTIIKIELGMVELSLLTRCCCGVQLSRESRLARDLKKQLCLLRRFRFRCWQTPVVGRIDFYDPTLEFCTILFPPAKKVGLSMSFVNNHDRLLSWATL